MSGNTRNSRNYAIDIIKLILAVFVFFNHTLDLGHGEVYLSRVLYTADIGWISVHYFFVISGFLMVMSFMRRGARSDSPGRDTASFVWGKFRSIGLEYYVSFFLAFIVYLAINHQQLSAAFLSNLSFHVLPELLLINRAGIDTVYINLPTWYIQCMLLGMVPLYYLLRRHGDLFVRVLAPMGALLGLSFMFRQDNFFIAAKGCDYLLTNGLIRGMTGILCGASAYPIYEKLKNADLTKKQRRIFAAAEILLYIWLFIGCFTAHCDRKGHFLALLLIPPATALTFSGAGCSAKLFSSEKWRFANALSLTIYFNNWSARRIIEVWFPDMSWLRSTVCMTAFTAVLCAAYWIILVICRKLWQWKLKEIFTLKPASE